MKSFRELKEGESAIYMGARFPIVEIGDECLEPCIVLKGNYGNLEFRDIKKRFLRTGPDTLRIKYTDNICDELEVVDDGGFKVEFRKDK